MTIRRKFAVSVVTAAALLLSALPPSPNSEVLAQAQRPDGRGAGGGNPAGPPPTATPPTRSAPPTINRGPTSTPNVTPERTVQPRDIRRNRDTPPTRVIVGDGDRRRGDGDGNRRRGTRYVWAPGIAFYFYDGFYHGDCSWLRRKARETGSRYWRQRYEKCRDE